MRRTLNAWMSDIDIARERRNAAELAICQAEREFGAEVRRIRTERGITLRELARRANLSPQMVHDFEMGRRWSYGFAERVQVLLAPPPATRRGKG